MPSYPIIDAHTHIEGLPGSPWQDPPELMLRLMDEAGIAKAVVMTYCDAPLGPVTAEEELEETLSGPHKPGCNCHRLPRGLVADGYDPLQYVREACQRYPERLIGFARLNPGKDEACDLLAQAVGEWGFRGLKLHPFGYRIPPDHECTLKLMRKAAQLSVPALFHCGDEEYTLPLQLERAARAVPECQIIFGHMGGYFHVRDAIEVAKRCPNVYLETSATPHVNLIREAIELLGPERVIYASDGPGCDPTIEVKKVEMIGLGEADAQRVFSANILRLMGVEG
ncbi:MAG: amidohydrolase family protein [Candidatus Sericytochromatia bacterium]